MIICFNGKKGTGKDLLADYLVNKYKFVKIENAKIIKDIAKIMFGFSNNELYGSQEEKETINNTYGLSPREAFLEIGYFMKKHLPSKYPLYKQKIDDNYFVLNVINKIKNNINKNIIISDVRYDNEVTLVKKYFPDTKIIVVRLLRKTKVFNVVTDDHPSENLNNIKKIDYIINNNGKIIDVYNKIDIIVNNKN